MSNLTAHSRLAKQTPRIAALMLASALIVAPARAQDDAQTTPTSSPAATETEAAAKDGPTPSNLDPEAAAIAFVEAVIADATAALTNEASTPDVRLSEFQDVLSEGLALKTLSKFMIGRGAYDEMSDGQRARYEAVFPDYITKQYAEQFDGILGRPLKVTETTPFRKDIFVRTQFVDETSSPINVDWRTRSLRSGGHKLIDIIVNGASIMSVKKSEFEGFIAQNGVDALIDRLEAETRAA